MARRFAFGTAALLTAVVATSVSDAHAAPPKARRSPVTAEKVREAERLVNEAAALYQANRYKEAIALFERAYTLDPHPIILLNIGRAHNRNGALEQALHFYRRYLKRAPKAEDRAQIEERVRHLEEALGRAPAQRSEAEAGPLDEPPPTLQDAEQEEAIKNLPSPPEPAKAGGTAAPPPIVPPPRGQPVGVSATKPRGIPNPQAAAQTRATPRVLKNPFRVQIGPGVAVPSFVQKKSPQPTPQIETRPLFSLAIAGVYAAPVPIGFIDIALTGHWSPLSYETIKAPRSVLSHFFGGFLSTTLRAAVTDRFFMGASVAAGAYWWTGLHPDNPFTRNGLASDPSPMPSFRVGLPILGDLGNHLLLGFEPAFSISKTTSQNLSNAIDSIQRFELNGVFAVVF
ncbi:MAG TPA: tetratricopeptide repeat protein [Polyangia bacterium]